MTRPTFDNSSPEPLYAQIQRWMQGEIQAGRWPRGHKLPAEEDLAPDLGVSRGTLRRAIREMAAEGLLQQIHGKGTFVATPRIEQPLAQRLAAFTELLAESGIAYSTRVLRQEVRPCSEQLAPHLQIDPGQPVLYLDRVRLVADEPVAYMENHVALHIAPGIEQVDFERNGLFQTLEQQYGVPLAWGERLFEAVPADMTRAERLEVSPGTPLFYLQQVVFRADGVPIEHSDVWLRGNRFRLAAVVQRHVAADSPLVNAINMKF